MADQALAPRHPAIRSSTAMMARMAAMMFLQYWPLGIWGVTVGTFIAANTGNSGERTFSAGFVGYSTAAGAIGSLLSPVLLGFLSDRYFASQWLLALMHVFCAAAAWGMYESHSQLAFFLWLLIYFQSFSPAAVLTNKIALKHLSNADTEYPLVRIFGTAGWISAGLFLGFVWPWITGESIEATRTPLLLGSFASVVMAAYSLTLPHTPPEPRGGELARPAFQDSAELLGNRPLVMFLVLAMLACVPSMAYNNYGNLFLNRQGFPRPAALMTLGQLSDLVVLSLTPWLVSRFGLHKLFASGIIAWGIRYVLLAAGSHFDTAWPVYAAIMLHGICYVFVYVIGVMYVGRLVAESHQGAAQGMYALASAGLGHLLGAAMVGLTQATFLTPEGVSPAPYNWTAFWAVPAIVALLTAVAYLLAFKRLHQVQVTTI